MNITKSAKRIVYWPFEQTAGWLKNAASVVSDYEAEDFLPEAAADVWDWLRDQVPRAFGFGTPGEQMSASVVLAIASIFTSVFTGGFTIAAVFLFAVTFLGGALRLWPFIDDLWPFGPSET